MSSADLKTIFFAFLGLIARSSGLLERFLGGLDREEWARLRELQKLKETEIAALLTPEEREQRLYRESDASRYVRQHVPQAKSEAEFHDMVRLAAEFNLANMPASVEFRHAVPGAEVAASLPAAVALAGEGEAFVMGGGELYAQALPLADRLLLTEVDLAPEGDGPR